jgi:HD-GYP domain-containing protein (c-di-GMP phosphodiesterase class II)
MFLRVLDSKFPYTSALRLVEDRYGFFDIDIEDTIQTSEAEYLSLVVFDLKINSDHQRRRVQDQLRALGDVPIVVICDMKSQSECAFWKGAGQNSLIHKNEKPANIMATISKVMEDYIHGIRNADNAPDIAMKAANAALTSMAESVRSREALKDQMLDVAAQHIVSLLNNNRASDWLSIVEMHHSQTFQHCMTVASNLTLFSIGLGLSPKEHCHMTKAGLMHDLGKLFVPLDILDKPGKLSAEEYSVVKEHPRTGADFLSEHSCLPQSIIDMTRSHHEFLDGSGYPDGLSADEISPMVRMMTIADIFSALTEKRAYKEVYSPRVAMGMMWDMKGKLDPELLKQFANIVCGTKVGKVGSRRRHVA